MRSHCACKQSTLHSKQNRRSIPIGPRAQLGPLIYAYSGIYVQDDDVRDPLVWQTCIEITDALKHMSFFDGTLFRFMFVFQKLEFGIHVSLNKNEFLHFEGLDKRTIQAQKQSIGRDGWRGMWEEWMRYERQAS